MHRHTLSHAETHAHTYTHNRNNVVDSSFELPRPPSSEERDLPPIRQPRALVATMDPRKLNMKPLAGMGRFRRLTAFLKLHDEALSKEEEETAGAREVKERAEEEERAEEQHKAQQALGAPLTRSAWWQRTLGSKFPCTSLTLLKSHTSNPTLSIQVTPASKRCTSMTSRHCSQRSEVSVIPPTLNPP